MRTVIPTAGPDEQARGAPRWALLDALAASHVVDARVAPAAAVAVGVREAAGWRFAAGAAGHRSALRPEVITEATPFDLASVTKPVVACTVARLVRGGALRFEEALGDALPEVGSSPSSRVPLLLFLSHRAGLEAHLPLYAPALRGERVHALEAARSAAASRREDCRGEPPGQGFSPHYSDLGYLLLGLAAERQTAAPLDSIVVREVSEPLGLDLASSAQWQARDPGFLDRVAPTEVMPSRGGEIVGVVHDENAWALGGMAGHAGLFGTAASVARFGAAVLEAAAGGLPGWLLAAEIEVLLRERDGGTLRAGFDGRSPEGSSAGTEFGPRSFGHLGFTGTSLWCDPDASVVAAVLTNRVSPTRDHVAIRAARPSLHDALHRAARILGGRERASVEPPG